MVGQAEEELTDLKYLLFQRYDICAFVDELITYKVTLTLQYVLTLVKQRVML